MSVAQTISKTQKSSDPLSSEAIWQEINKYVLKDVIKKDNNHDQKANHFLAVFRNDVLDEALCGQFALNGKFDIEKPDLKNLGIKYLQKRGAIFDKNNKIVNLNNEQRLELFFDYLGHLSTVPPYERQQTTHPTQTLDTKTIERKEKFQKYISTNLDNILSGKLRTSKAFRDEFIKKAKGFWRNFDTPSAKLSRDQESTRGLRQSRHLYDSVSEFASYMLDDVAIGTFGIDIHRLSNENRHLLFERCARYAGKATKQSSWDLDADGKLETGTIDARESFRKNKLSIWQQCIHDLAEIAVKLDKEKDADKIDSFKVSIWGLLRNIERIYPVDVNMSDGSNSKKQQFRAKINRFINVTLKKDGASEQAIELIKSIWNDREEPACRSKIDQIRRQEIQLKDREQELKLENKSLDTDALYKNYEQGYVQLKEEFKEKFADYRSKFEISARSLSADNLIKILSGISKNESVEKIKNIRNDGRYSNLPLSYAKMSDFISFKDSALNQVYRQSAGVFKECSDYVLEFVNDKFSHEFIEMVKKRSRFTGVSEAKITKKELMQILKTKDPQGIELAERIRESFRKHVDNEIDGVNALKKNLFNIPGVPDKNAEFEKIRKRVYGIEPPAMFMLLAENSDAHAFTLISENNSAEDIFNARLCEEIVALPNDQRKPVVPLTEYGPDIRNNNVVFQEMVDKGYMNPLIKGEQFLFKYNESTKSYEALKIKDLIDQILNDNKPFKDFISKKLDKLLQQDLDNYNQNHNQNISLDEYKEGKVFGACIMKYAGSDASKSASTNIYTIIADKFLDHKIYGAVKGIYLLEDMGGGSGAARYALHNYMIRTRQGVEMDQGPTYLCAENIFVITANANSRIFNLDKIELGSPRNNKERFLVAAINIGNRANLEQKLSEYAYKMFSVKSSANTKSYDSLYKSKEFSNFVDTCIPKDMEQMVSNGARALYRPGGKSGVEGQRAIGYNASWGFSGFSSLSVNYKISKHLKLDSSGNLINPESALQNFIKNPRLQDLAARSLLVTAETYDINTAWRNVNNSLGLKSGKVKSLAGREGYQNSFYTIEIGGKSYNLNDIVNLKKDSEKYKEISSALQNSFDDNSSRKAYLENKIASMNKGKQEKNRITKADFAIRIIKQAATVSLEVNNTTKAICDLYEYAIEKFKLNVGDREFLKLKNEKNLVNKLIGYTEIINPDLGFSLRKNRESAMSSLQVISDYFKKSCKGEFTVPKSLTDAKEKCQDLLSALANIKNMGEQVPGAYKNPEKALLVSFSKHLYQGAKVEIA